MSVHLPRSALDRLRRLASPSAGEPPPPSERLDKYELVRVLGRGATGIVYEGLDPDLNRNVAIKVLQEVARDQETVRQRFIREGRVAAQLSHPNVVTVFDVGEAGDKLFLVMELVRGESLTKEFDRSRRDRRRLLGMLERVALGVHHAHQHGIVHRDLKPANIMVTGNGDPKVMDFGLAHLVSTEPALTHSGMAVGTPLYMAPEQISGTASDITPRTDVYALGAILYQALTGVPPHRGRTAAECFARIQLEEPVPPRRMDRSVAIELETICLKALDKSPGRRYATAEEFARDLRRYLSGEPISARPPSAVAGLVRGAKRRWPAITGAVGVGVVSAVILFRFFGHPGEALEQARARADELLLTSESLRRAGDPDEMKRHAERAERACRDMASTFSGLPDPHYAMGRIYRALLRDTEALAEQEKALAMNPDFVRSRYERIVLTGRAYEQRATQLEEDAWRMAGIATERAGGGEMVAGLLVRIPSREALMSDDPGAREMRKRMEEDLHALMLAVRRKDPELQEAELSCARGLVARIEKDRGNARAYLEDAVGRRPLEEGYEALAALALEENDPAGAVRWLTAGWERCPGFLPLLEWRGRLFALLGDRNRERGEEAETSYRRSEEDFNQILNRSPERRMALLGRAQARLGRAIARGKKDPDSLRLWNEAMADYGAAIHLDETNDQSWEARALGRLNSCMLSQGAETTLADACADFSRAIELNPRQVRYRLGRAVARMNAGVSRSYQGADAEADFQMALEDIDLVLRVHPQAQAWAWRGKIRTGLIDARRMKGMASEELCEEAIRDFSQALTLDPSNLLALTGRGYLKTLWGFSRTRRVEEVESLFRDAVEDLDKAWNLNPRASMTRIFRGLAYSGWASNRQRREAADDLIARAMEDFRDEGLDEAMIPVARCWRGHVRQLAAANQADRGDVSSARTTLEKALEDLEEAVRLAPGYLEARLRRASLQFLRVRILASVGGDFRGWYESSRSDLATVLTVLPNHPEALHLMSMVGGGLASLAEQDGKDPIPHYRESQQALNRLLEIDRSNGLVWLSRGLLHYSLGIHLLKQKEDVSAPFRIVEESFAEAFRLRPELEAKSSLEILSFVRQYLQSGPRNH